MLKKKKKKADDIVFPAKRFASMSGQNDIYALGLFTKKIRESSFIAKGIIS